MADHQWLHRDLGNGVLVTTRTEMTAVLLCAASLARKEGMPRTAERLTNDAVRVEELSRSGQVTIIVQP